MLPHVEQRCGRRQDAGAERHPPDACEPEPWHENRECDEQLDTQTSTQFTRYDNAKIESAASDSAMSAVSSGATKNVSAHGPASSKSTSAPMDSTPAVAMMAFCRRRVRTRSPAPWQYDSAGCSDDVRPNTSMLTTLSRYMTTENAATASVPPICSSTVFTTRSMTDDAVLSKKSDEPLNASLWN